MEKNNKELKNCPFSFSAPQEVPFIECDNRCAWYDENSGKCSILDKLSRIISLLDELNDIKNGYRTRGV